MVKRPAVYVVEYIWQGLFSTYENRYIHRVYTNISHARQFARKRINECISNAVNNFNINPGLLVTTFKRYDELGLIVFKLSYNGKILDRIEITKRELYK